MNNIKLKKNKWYFIKYPGSNLGGDSFTGKAKCIDNIANTTDFCGGPAYIFSIPKLDGSWERSAFGIEDVVFEMKNETELDNIDVRLTKLEKIIKKFSKLLQKGC